MPREGNEPRAALVTGASSGIGRAVAADLIARGWAVSAVARRPERAGLDGAHLVAADLADPAACRDAVAAHLARHGRLDLLVASAGTLTYEPVLDVTGEAWTRQFDVNVRGVFEVVRAAIPRLLEDRGLVVAIGSMAGLGALPGAPVYTATKHALLGLVRSLNHELLPGGVRCTAVLPGYVDTPMAQASGLDPAGMVRVEDVVAAVRFLLELAPGTFVPELVLDRTASVGR
jgi:NAD(P)-dependent dehydrogenase (short-subunit alcohol dehydrogenase family)